MMHSSYFAFVLASIAVAAIPGPGVLLITAQAITLGRNAMLPLVAGIMLGDLVAMTVSLVGVTALLQAFPAGFAALKYTGAAYLVFLGLHSWRAGMAQQIPPASPFWATFLTTASNPKSLSFFILFMAPFIKQNAPALPQCILLGATYLVIGAVNAAVYIHAASTFATTLASSSNKPTKTIRRVGAVVLVMLGIAMVL